MNRHAIAAHAVAHAGLRLLASEYFGPRPGGTRTDVVGQTVAEIRDVHVEAETPITAPSAELRATAATRP